MCSLVTHAPFGYRVKSVDACGHGNAANHSVDIINQFVDIILISEDVINTLKIMGIVYTGQDVIKGVFLSLLNASFSIESFGDGTHHV